jgi:hypothetical protein
MFSSTRRRTRTRTALCATAIALLAALPTASAFADSAAAGSGAAAPATAPTAPLTTAPGELLAPGQLEELLAQLPLSDLSTAQLAQYLAELEDIEALAQLHVELGLHELGLPRLEEGLAEGIEQLGAGATLGELADPQQLVPALETQLDGLLTTLLGSTLGAEQTQQLTEALEKVSLSQLVGALLETAKEPSELSGLATLADGLLEKLEPAALTGLLGGSALEGPFSATTVEEAAKELGTSSEALSGELGQTAAELPATATMLTAPVGGRKLLAVAPAAKGLALSLLGGLPGEEEGGKGGGGEGEGEGGSGGEGKGSGLGQGGGGTSQSTGGAGGQGASAGGTTLVVNLPASGSGAAPTTSAAQANAPAAKVAILGAKTHGSAVTVTLRVPAAGRVTVSGAAVRARTVTAPRAGRLTVTLRLTRAGAAARHRHHGRLAVRVRAAFVSRAGVRSSAGATARFR